MDPDYRNSHIAYQTSSRRLPWVSDRTAQDILFYLHFATPVVLLVSFLISLTAHSIFSVPNSNVTTGISPTQRGPGGKPLPDGTPHRKKPQSTGPDFTPSQKILFRSLSVAAAVTFVANAANVILHALAWRDEGWWCGQSYVIYSIGTFFVYTLYLLSLFETSPSPNWSHLAAWVVSFMIEVVLLGASVAVYSGDHREPTVGDEPGKLERGMTMWEIMEIVFDILRIILLLALISFYGLFMALRKREGHPAVDASETTNLLSANGQPNGQTNGQANGLRRNEASASYGSMPTGGKHKHTEGEPAGWSRPAQIPSRSWWEYIKGFMVFFPYIWPSKDRRLQLLVVICFMIVLLQRAVNVLLPLQSGKITNILAGDAGPVRMPWGDITLYVFYRFLQGNSGILGAIRGNLWIPISQYSYREVSVASFEHVHSLSLDFHLGKKTGEVISALNKGASINTFLESFTFQVIPMLVDLAVAIGVFLKVFDAYYALVVGVVTFWYVYLTMRMAQWRAGIRREMVNADREEEAVKNDSLMSYETVKYFNAEDYEFDRYRGAVKKYQKAEYRVNVSLNLMNTAQNLVFMLGLMVTTFIAAFQISIRQRTVGDFVTLLTYMTQLQQPLNFFGTFYRMIQSAMINAERLLELFKEQPSVVDSPNAKPMGPCHGEIRFNDVHFAYDERKPALQGLDFRCPPGTTTAFVGESGGGKSTVFRLLFRFYNMDQGSIQVDGHDIRDVTIDSLRSNIGVVPQDTVLFNESIMYNLRYANPNASDEEVFTACRAASIHDRIMSFPDGYDAKVGERGLRLSGGEKQRVAIARTILKNPRIILLDEATAALDTETEEHIQEALTTLGRGRTMLVIAHRLSTITMADQILVLHQGQVAERGTHDELLAKKGRYANMWRKQVRAQKAAEESARLKDKADRLRKESKDGSMGLKGIHDDGSESPDSGSGSASHSEDEKEKERQAKLRREREQKDTTKRGRDDDQSPRGGRPAGHP